MNIDFDKHHPYFRTIAEYYWSKGLAVVYTNENNDLIEHWADGSYALLEKDKALDKRYSKPFEDDGAYAD